MLATQTMKITRKNCVDKKMIYCMALTRLPLALFYYLSAHSSDFDLAAKEHLKGVNVDL